MHMHMNAHVLMLGCACWVVAERPKHVAKQIIINDCCLQPLPAITITSYEMMRRLSCPACCKLREKDTPHNAVPHHQSAIAGSIGDPDVDEDQSQQSIGAYGKKGAGPASGKGTKDVTVKGVKGQGGGDGRAALVPGQCRPPDRVDLGGGGGAGGMVNSQVETGGGGGNGPTSSAMSLPGGQPSMQVSGQAPGMAGRKPQGKGAYERCSHGQCWGPGEAIMMKAQNHCAVFHQGNALPYWLS